MQIRISKKEDLQNIVKITTENIKNVKRVVIYGYLQNTVDFDKSLVAEEDGQIVGTLLFGRPTSKTIEGILFVISPDYRKNRLDRKMLVTALSTVLQ
jgi:predicted N-acetyltransferase YhbS